MRRIKSCRWIGFSLVVALVGFDQFSDVTLVITQGDVESATFIFPRQAERFPWACVLLGASGLFFWLFWMARKARIYQHRLWRPSDAQRHSAEMVSDQGDNLAQCSQQQLA